MTTDRKLYEEMYARQLAEGHDLETAMRFNKAATSEDFRRAFGRSDDPRQQWRKWGGGNKMGSAGAAVNAARKAQTASRDAQRAARDNPFSIPSLNNVLMAGDPNRGLNRSRDYDVNTGDLKGITTDSDFGIRMREAVYGSPPKA